MMLMTKPQIVFEPLIYEAAGGTFSVSRAKVPGGWLLLFPNNRPLFIPDPDHFWDGCSLP